MTEIICSALAAVSAIVCAVVGVVGSKRAKREDARAEQRAKEGRLQLAMIAANNELSIGTAMAVKNGHANGEMQRGLEEVEKAQKAYRQFLEETALEQIRT